MPLSCLESQGDHIDLTSTMGDSSGYQWQNDCAFLPALPATRG